MANEYGMIKDGDRVAFPRVELQGMRQRPRAYAPSGWSGSFPLPSGQYSMRLGLYRLILEDGRTGDIIVHYIHAGRVEFSGSGPLAH
jgi:hypothetical protein